MLHEFFSIALLALFIGTQHLLDDKGLLEHEVGTALWERYVLNCDTRNLTSSLKICLGKLRQNPRLSDILTYFDSKYAVDKVWDNNSLSEVSITNFLLGKRYPPDALFIGGLVLLCLVLRIIKDGGEEPPNGDFGGLFSRYPVNLVRFKKDYHERWD